jgi:hypothetical protein
LWQLQAGRASFSARKLLNRWIRKRNKGGELASLRDVARWQVGRERGWRILRLVTKFSFRESFLNL